MSSDFGWGDDARLSPVVVRHHGVELTVFRWRATQVRPAP